MMRALVLFIILIAAIPGIGAAHADAAPLKPGPVRVAHELGYRLAVDPRVMYPPQDVSCWYPSSDRFAFECTAYRRDVNAKGWYERDYTYGVKIRMYEDKSWTISYKMIFANSSVRIRS